MTNPKNRWEAAFKREVRHRKQWTIKGAYINSKRQAKLKSISADLVAQDKPVFFGRRQEFSFWLKHKLVYQHTVTGHQKYAFAFTQKGKELFNIWHGRKVLLGELGSLANGDPEIKYQPYITMK